jgi:hypothetical protein
MKSPKLLKNFFGQLIRGQALQIKASKPWLTLFWICLYLDLRKLFKRVPPCHA